ncbi:hypothetical protein G7046_g2514 [Stylonectria norvegica]|nr:hypothetical protein G7046_g2514 [Stylonectria norvegica]
MGDMLASTEQRSAVDPFILIKQLKLLLAEPNALMDKGQRQELKHLASQAAGALEAPFETVQRLAYAPLPLVIARVAQDHRIYSTLAAASEPVELQRLSLVTGLGTRVLETIMDYLCTQNMAQEAEPGRYSATKLTHLLIVPLFQDAVTHFHDNCLPAFSALNTVLNTPGSHLTAFKVGQHTEEDFYTWMETHHVQQGAFHRFMEAQFASLPTWLDDIDFQSELAKDAAPTETIFVDVGGGSGQQCASLKASYPNLEGKVVLQDRPDVLQKALAVEGMENMSYDFLTQQPVKDARVYYFRQIMHNFDDETCIRILQSQLPAMGPHSVVIIDDKVLPDEKPQPDMPGVEYTAGLSLAMKVMFDAMERREAHWRQLLTAAGLEIRGIRKYTKFNNDENGGVKRATDFHNAMLDLPGYADDSLLFVARYATLAKDSLQECDYNEFMKTLGELDKAAKQEGKGKDSESNAPRCEKAEVIKQKALEIIKDCPDLVRDLDKFTMSSRSVQRAIKGTTNK